MDQATIFPWHSHAWGEFVYAYSGLMEIKLTQRHLLAPSQYGIWIPPHVEHIGLNRHAASYCSVYLAKEWCDQLPETTCALTVTPLTRSILEHLRHHIPARPPSAAEQRLLSVLVDQLIQAPCAGSYLPGSKDPQLSHVLADLQHNPADPRSLAQLASSVNTSERTLMRRCQRDLGMSFAEWRQRLKTVKAMEMLEQGVSVETTALDLGYSSASAFIAMFRRLINMTPDEYRRNHQAGTS